MKPESAKTPGALAEDLAQRQVLRDLFALLAIPSLTNGRSRQGVLESLLDSVAAVVPVAIAFARATSPAGAPVEAVRPKSVAPARFDRLRAAIETVGRPGLDPITFTEEDGRSLLRLVVIPLGFYGDAGFLALATARRDFPTERERLLLGAVSSLGAAALENATLLETLVESDRRKDEFLALLGHELRNPLAPVLTAVQLMKLRGEGPARSRDMIERQVLHMVRLVDDLLDVSRISRGKLELRNAPLDLAGAVGHAVELAAPLIERGGHALEVDVPSGVVLDGDIQRLAQVFANLLGNAAKYTEAGGRITLRATVDGDHVAITVRDNGRGIPKEMLARIFEPFIQAERRKDALSGGLGLGLTIVKNLVTLHGGRVSASSEGPGLGSEFRVELPLAGGEGTRRSDKETMARAPLRLRRALVVDDNEDAASLLAAALRQRGHEAWSTTDPHDGLRLARDHGVDVALLDLAMPELSGYELGARLRRDGSDIQIIAVTGHASESARVATRRAGFDAHLVKPIDLSTLFALLEGPPC